MVSYYKQHSANLWMVNRAIKSVQRSLREYISKDEDLNTYIFTMLLSHLVNSWVEVRVLKLVYEKNGFNASDRNKILECKSTKERWELALTIAFRKAYEISSSKNIDSVTISITARTRYKKLMKLIDKDLLASNQLRNKIAHGQWKYAFNKDLSSINGPMMGMLRQENIVKLQLKLKIFTSLAQIIHDLTVSKRTFEKDYDPNYRRIEEQTRNFHNRNYEDYRKKMILKRKRGIEKRRAKKLVS